jgi:hypothetical protein
MRLTLRSSAFALGLSCALLAACSKTQDREARSRPELTAAEQRRLDEKRAEDKRAEERRADERRAEERKAERKAEERRAEERRAEQRVEEQRRLEDRRETERRAEERRDSRQARSVGGDPALTPVRATPASALASVATERCDREARCKNIGAKEKYRDRADCIAQMERDKRDDLNSDVCTGGVRQKELADCLQAIRGEDCGNPLDSLTRLTACRAGNLCAK